MEEQVGDPVQEIKRLRRCINDLTSLLALPALWRGTEPSHIVAMLLDVLLRILNLDFAFARWTEASGAQPLEMVRVSKGSNISLRPEELKNVLAESFADYTQGSLAYIRRRLGNEDISLYSVPLGVEGETGTILVGSSQAGFPENNESFLLSVAANQLSIGLQEARLQREQKRIAAELEQRIAERTRELAETNKELRNEIAERELAQQRLRNEEQELKRSEERWRSVFENSAVGVALTDLNGRFISTNPVYQKMLGYTEGELQRLTFFDITHEDDVEQKRSLIGDLVTGKHREFQIEKQYRRKNGQPVWTRNNVSIVPGTDRVPRFLLCLSEDITQRKLSEEALAKARLELAKVASTISLGVLTASIAHEVNQPLSGIITNANTCLRMLSANPPNIEGAQETVRRTLRDGTRAADVIVRLRTLYSKKEPSPELMNLNDTTREVVALFRSELDRSGVTLRFELASDLQPVLGDRIQLQQVILNLLRNAADAMSAVDDRPRELLIRTEQADGNQVRLSVRDSGAGFLPDAADKVFDAFYTTKTDGMGIGLSICRSIIEAHQGRIWAAANDGHGATFSFVIPSTNEGVGRNRIDEDGADPSKDAA